MKYFKTPKLLKHLAFLSLFITAIMIFTIICWLLYPYKPIEFMDGDFKTNSEFVMQGEYLSYTIDYCKNNELTPQVSTSFVDGIIYTTPRDPQAFYPKGCHIKNFLIYIPKALPAGSYYIQHNYHFKVNPIRTIDIEAKTINFMVLER